MSWLFPNRSSDPAIEARVADALLAGDEAKDVIQKIVETSAVEKAEADELADTVRARLAQLEARRARRIHDPRISVVVETVRILQGRT